MIKHLRWMIEVRAGFLCRPAHWFLFFCLACGAPLSAQETGTADTLPKPADTVSGFKLREMATNIRRDQELIWTAPARMNSRQWLTLGVPITGMTAALIAVDERSMTVLPNTPGQIRWCGRVSDLGALYSLSGFSAGLLVTGKLTNKSWLFKVGQGSTEALVDSMIVSYSIKYGTGRERPTQNDGEGRFWKGGDSFPSGHSMNTWAIAASLARRHNCPKWIAIASYGMAGAVSFSRWGAEKHFPSDIVFGSVLGWFIGNHVARRPR